MKTLDKRKFKTTSFTSFLSKSIYSQPTWENWFRDKNFFYLEEIFSINNNDYIVKAIPLAIAEKLQSIDDLDDLNNKPYLDISTRLNNENTIEQLKEQIYTQSEYASKNFKNSKIHYICWIYKNGYLESINECKYKNIQELKKQRGVKSTIV